ncbi:MAG: ribonuclease HI [Actinomycetaceae bacterium]|nr:ribonuclease HI [Actinomycetaceae bacterium]
MNFSAQGTQLSLFGDDDAGLGSVSREAGTTPDAGGDAKPQAAAESTPAAEPQLPAGVREHQYGEPVGRIRPEYDLIIATDGSCSGNPGPGGWAFVEQTRGYAQSGGARATTNNIMELTAMLRALEYAGPDADLLLRVDSKYVIDSMTKWAAGWRRRGWKKADGKPVLNRDLIEPILNLYEARRGKTDVEWVRGHQGDPANELADTLAVEQTALHARK